MTTVTSALVVLLVAGGCTNASNNAAVAGQRPVGVDASGEPVEIEAVPADPPAEFNLDGQAAGQGYDIHLSAEHDGSVTLTLSVSPPPSADHLPVVGHYTDDGWDWEPATYDADAGTFTVTASDFSYRVPFWSPARDAIADALDSLVDRATGKTDPPDCKGQVPAWADIALFSTNAVHTCWHDPQGDGTPELLIKSNRGAFLIVTLPERASYVWVEEQPDWARPMLSSVSGSGLAPESAVLLPPGKSLSFGWDRPEPGPVPVEPVVSVYTTQATILMSSAASLVDLFAETDRQLARWVAAALLYHECSTKLAGIDPLAADLAPHALSGMGFFREFVTCVAGGVGLLADPAKATEATYDIWGDQLHKLDSKTQAEVASTFGGKLTTLGLIAKLFTTALLASKVVTGFHDGIVDALLGVNSATVTLMRPKMAGCSAVAIARDLKDDDLELDEGCFDGWAVVDTCPDCGGDTQVLVRLVGGVWRLEHGFPAPMCRDEARAAGVPDQFLRRFSACAQEPERAPEVLAEEFIRRVALGQTVSSIATSAATEQARQLALWGAGANENLLVEVLDSDPDPGWEGCGFEGDTTVYCELVVWFGEPSQRTRFGGVYTVFPDYPNATYDAETGQLHVPAGDRYMVTEVYEDYAR